MVDLPPNFMDDQTGANGSVTVDNAQLVSIDSKLNSLGQKASSASVPVVLASDQDPIEVVFTNNPTDFTFGAVTLAVIAIAVVRSTVYTEQTSNAQRSIASASANDTSAGTGARTVEITYLDDLFNGPFNETVTLNGTTYVNTVATNICYIERIKVLTVGSTGSNAGIITLKAATAGGGATIGTIAAATNQTLWAHHYVPTGKIAHITGISVSHNGTTVGSGGVFTLLAKKLNVANSVDIQISDFVRLYGQSSTFARVYQSALKVVGPARLAVWVLPETSSSTLYRAAIDFNEV